MNGQLGMIFQQAAEKMKERAGDSAEEIWQEVWKKEGLHTFLLPEDIEMILLFGRSLGYLDKIQQENSMGAVFSSREPYLWSPTRGKPRLENWTRIWWLRPV